MRLIKGTLFAAFAAILLMASGTSATAAIIPVYSDSGNLGVFSLTRIGFAAGVSTMQLTILNPPGPSGVHLDTVDGVQFLPEPGAVFTTPMIFTMTAIGGGNYIVSSPVFGKTFLGDAGVNAQLQYNVTAASAPFSSFLNLSGMVTGVTSPLLGYQGNTYDFSAMTGGTNALALIGTTFSGGATSFNDVILTGGSVTGNGIFAENSLVPEPSSIALFGIGAATAFGLSRRRKVETTS
jgi:hypothetical protein